MKNTVSNPLVSVLVRSRCSAVVVVVQHLNDRYTVISVNGRSQPQPKVCVLNAASPELVTRRSDASARGIECRPTICSPLQAVRQRTLSSQAPLNVIGWGVSRERVPRDLAANGGVVSVATLQSPTLTPPHPRYKPGTRRRTPFPTKA